MLARRIAAVGVGAAIVAAPVAAQLSGSRIRQASPNDALKLSLTPAERSRRIMDGYAACLVDFDRAKVVKYLAMPISEKSDEVGRKLAIDECLEGGEMQFSPSLLRGGLFRALYRADFTRKAPVAAADSTVDYRVDVDGDTASPRAAQYVLLHQFADCIVQADAINGRELTLAQAGSDREKSAFAALSPRLGPCMPQNVSATLNKATITGLIAESLYRQSTAAKSSAGAH